MKYLMECWFPSRDEFADESTLAEAKRYGHFAIGAVSDALSFFHNLSQHIVCLDQLSKLPEKILDICDIEYGKEAKYLNGKHVDEEYWGGRLKTFNDHLTNRRRKAEKHGEKHNDVKWIGGLLNRANFVDYISQVLLEDENNSQTVNPNFIDNDEEVTSLFQLLPRVIPYIERRIFVAHISSPTPFYSICRQSHVFRLYFILLLYQLHEELNKDFKELSQHSTLSRSSHKIAGLDSWRFKAFSTYTTVDKKQFLYLAGPYVQGKDSTKTLSTKLSNLLVNSHCLKLSPHNKNKQPKESIFRAALAQRIQCNQKENDTRVNQLARTCNLLQQITAEVADICKSLLGVDDLVALSSALCWLEEKERYAAKLNQVKSRNRVFQIRQGPETQNIFLAQLAKKPSGSMFMLSQAEKYEETYAFNGEPHEVIGLSLTQIRNAILRSRHNLHRNVTEQMSHLLNGFTGINYFQESSPDCKIINREVKRACHAICSLLCRATGADSAQLYLVNHSGKDLLKTVGIFSRDPSWMIAKEIDDFLNKNKDEKRFDDKSKSFVIRAIGSRPVFLPRLSEKNSHLTPAYGEFKPKSGIAVPLSIHGRVLGVLQIKGAHYEQFSRGWDGVFIQTAELLAPFLYQLRMTNTLTQIQQLLAGEIDFSSQQEKLNQASEKLCDILLIDNIYFLIKDENRADSFSVKGHNYDSNFLKMHNIDINQVSIKINLAEKNRLLSHFPGSLIGKNTRELLMDRDNRFDYLHCKYKSKENKLSVKIYSEKERKKSQKKYYEINKFIENINKFFQIIYKDTKYGGLAKEEALVFPIVSPPIDLPDDQKNIFLDEDDGLLILGFIVAHNKIYRPLGLNWENIIQACSQAISIGVNDSGALFTTRSRNERLIRHELRSYTLQIVRTLHSVNSRAHWLHRKMQRKSHAKNQELDTTAYISSQLKQLSDDIIPELHTQLEYQKAATTLQKLGINVDIMPEKIDIIEFLKNQVRTFEYDKKKSGQYIALDLHGELWVEIHPVALRHLFDNILSNAFKYAPSHSAIGIRIMQSKPQRICFTNSSLYAENDASTEDLKRIGIRDVRHVQDNNIDGEGVGLGIIQVLSKIFLKNEFTYTRGKKIQTQHLSDNSEKYFTNNIITLDFSKISI